MPDSRNPYLDLPLDQLAAACQAAARYLGDERPTLPADALERLRRLMVAAGARLAPEEVWGTQPRDVRDPKDFDEKLHQAHQHALTLARFRTLTLAADHYLPSAAESWLRDARVEGCRAYDLALESEEGLAAVLRAVADAGGRR